jgi:hypothetical protein
MMPFISYIEPVVQILPGVPGRVVGLVSASSYALPTSDHFFMPFLTNKCNIFNLNISLGVRILTRIISTRSGRYCSWDKLGCSSQAFERIANFLGHF